MKTLRRLLTILVIVTIGVVIYLYFPSNNIDKHFKDWNLSKPSDAAITYQKERGFTGDYVDVVIYNRSDDLMNNFRKDLSNRDYEEVPPDVMEGLVGALLKDNDEFFSEFDNLSNAKYYLLEGDDYNMVLVIETSKRLAYVFISI